jgi:nucleoid DNA-binding protein
VEEISAFSSFSPADVKGMLASFQHQLILHLTEGEIVELEGLGTFNVSLKSIPDATEQEVHATTRYTRRQTSRSEKFTPKFIFLDYR